MRLPIPLTVAIEWYIGQIASTTAQSQSRWQGIEPCNTIFRYFTDSPLQKFSPLGLSIFTGLIQDASCLYPRRSLAQLHKLSSGVHYH